MVMAGNFEALDIELFIDEVKTYPEIWNVADERYHDRSKKRGAWSSICRVFCEGFDDMDYKDKNQMCNALIKKWRNIKDNYVKSLKKKGIYGQPTNSGRRYVYSRNLAFLQITGAATETRPSLSRKDQDGVLEQSKDEKPRPNETQPEVRKQTPSFKQNSSRKRRREIESSLIDFRKTPIPPVAVVPEPNPDRLFFESILPSISDFTEDQKIEFRCEILNLIKRMRMSNHPQNYGYSPEISYSCPTTQSSNYLPAYQHPPKNFTAQQTCPTSLSHAFISDMKVGSPSNSSSTSVDSQVNSEGDIFSDGT